MIDEVPLHGLCSGLLRGRQRSDGQGARAPVVHDNHLLPNNLVVKGYASLKIMDPITVMTGIINTLSSWGPCGVSHQIGEKRQWSYGASGAARPHGSGPPKPSAAIFFGTLSWTK